MFADEIVTHCELLAQMDFGAYDRLAIQSPEGDSRFVIGVVDQHPHPFGFLLFVVYEFSFDVISFRIPAHGSLLPDRSLTSYRIGRRKTDDTKMRQAKGLSHVILV
jgi:hypothetical protein